MLRIATLLAIVLLVACDKGRKPPPTDTPVTPPKVETPKVKASAGVPQSLADKVSAEWPGIKAKGDAFVASFKEATAARAAGDRAKMDTAIEAAQKHYEDALEAWNTIYYDVDNYPEEQAEACRRFLRKWNKQVDSWTKKAKGLKEFSRVK